MEKKIYQAPSIESIYIAPSLSLLGESVDKGEDNGEGEADAKGFNLYEEEPILEWGSIWED